MIAKQPAEGRISASDALRQLNTELGHDVVADPFPRFEQLLAQGDVHIGNLMKEFGAGSDTVALGRVGDAYLIMGYESVLKVLADPRNFTNTGYVTAFGHSLIEMDDPEHRMHRRLVNSPFSRASIANWSTNITARANQLIDAFVSKGKADLAEDFAYVFPIRVIADLFGLPEADIPDIFGDTISIFTSGGAARAHQASKRMSVYFAGILAQRRANPGSDIVSLLLKAEVDGETLDDESLFGMLKLLLVGGAETTHRSISNLFYGLLTNPEQLSAVRADRSLIPAAVEETLRWQAPTTFAPRIAISDVEIAGTLIPKDSPVIAYLASANRDERIFPNPHIFDIHRKSRRPHLAFGSGPHLCLGMHLAKLEMALALQAMLERLPNLRLDPDDTQGTQIRGFILRSPARIPVLFDVQPG